MESTHLVAERRTQILETLDADRRVDTAALAARFDTSVDTIRRDLRALDRDGRLQRVHGGALPTVATSASYNGRRRDSGSARQRLAAAIVDRLEPGQVVGLDAGTTTTEIAALIPPDLAITVVTNGPSVALALADHPSATVRLVGGHLDLTWMAATGAEAVDAISEHHLDLAVVGVCALDADAGLMTRSTHEVATKRAFIAAAAHTVIPAESPKVETLAPYRIANVDDVSTILLAGEGAGAAATTLRSATAEVVVVD